MFRVDVEDRDYAVNVFHNEVLVHSVRTSHRLDGRDLANLLNSVYELGKQDVAKEFPEDNNNLFDYTPHWGPHRPADEVAHVESGVTDPFATIVG